MSLMIESVLALGKSKIGPGLRFCLAGRKFSSTRKMSWFISPRNNLGVCNEECVDCEEEI